MRCTSNQGVVMRPMMFLMIVVVTVVFAGCGRTVCEPEATRRCDCPSGSLGLETCDSETKTWGECYCASIADRFERLSADELPTEEEIERLRRELEGSDGAGKAPTPVPPREVAGLERISVNEIDQAQKSRGAVIAAKTLTAWASGQFDPMGDEFTSDLRTKLPPSEQQVGAAQMKAAFGDYQSLEFVEAWQRANVRVYRYKGTFTKSRPEVRVTFDNDGRVAGFWVLPWADTLD